MEGIQPEHDKGTVLPETFWKTQHRAIPGRPCQRVGTSEVMSGSSYQQFQASVNDAWDLGDDDIVSGIAETRISKAISQTAALNVINSHRKKTVYKGDVNTEIVKKEDVPKKVEVRKAGPGGSVPMRHYPGRPRAVKLSALASREESSESKLERFQQLQESDVIDLTELKQHSWSGIPVKVSEILFIHTYSSSLVHLLLGL